MIALALRWLAALAISLPLASCGLPAALARTAGNTVHSLGSAASNAASAASGL